jgi:hypothetical protein
VIVKVYITYFFQECNFLFQLFLFSSVCFPKIYANLMIKKMIIAMLFTMHAYNYRIIIFWLKYWWFLIIIWKCPFFSNDWFYYWFLVFFWQKIFLMFCAENNRKKNASIVSRHFIIICTKCYICFNRSTATN